MAMPDLSLLAWGVATGLAVSAPLGPVNFMCIRNTLRHGFWGGVFTGIGSVLGDGIFAAGAAMGIKFLARLVAEHEQVLMLAGGLFLLAIGIHACRTDVDGSDLAPPSDPARFLSIVATTLALTLSNPFTLAGFFAIFGAAAAGLTALDDQLAVVALVGSVMVGSSIWWLALARIVSSFRQHLDDRHARLINRATGGAIILFGTVVLVRLVLSATG